MITIKGPITFKAGEELPQAFKDKVNLSDLGIVIDTKAVAKTKKKETKTKKTSKKKSTKKGAKK